MAAESSRDRIRNLVVVLGDQLSPAISSLKTSDAQQDRVLMMEVAEETTYVRHHKKKIAFLFSAMRHFADELRELGWNVDYRKLDDPSNKGSFTGEVLRAAQKLNPDKIIITEPGEWRVREAMRQWSKNCETPVEVLDDGRFICSHDEFSTWASGRKQLRMEYFYREMRRKTGLLMNGNEPEGGRWNFDKENRKPAKTDLFMPRPLTVKPDSITREVLKLAGERFNDHFGDLEPFWFGVTRRDAEKAFDHFLAEALPHFGDFQDAMLRDERFLYHSVTSLYLNCGLLDPLDVCRKAEAAYRKGKVPLNAAEGFIRQIIGWREYVRGIYWLKMPEYRDLNALAHTRSVPWFYWNAKTKMACLKAAITQTKEEAYAHHIQRLMITGNFALLAGISPHELHEWYLIVYADAFEWVELPNTLGMSQFGDGGLLASKPYVASGAYINRMSDYCKDCTYDVKQRSGEGACPFNALYWDFLSRHRNRFKSNQRMTQMYRTYDNFPRSERQAIAETAENYLAKIDEL